MSAAEFKAQGNEAFKNKQYEESIEFYGAAIKMAPEDHVLYSNRSGSYASLEKYEEALEDATKCVELKGDWPKGYQRKGLAEFYLKKYDESHATYEQGLKIDPNNAQLKEGLQRAQAEKKISGVAGDFGDNPMAREMIQKLANNPETAVYLQDKEFVQKMQLCAQNPQMLALMSQSDPRVAKAMQVCMPGMDPSFMQNMFNQKEMNIDLSGGKFSGKKTQEKKEDSDDDSDPVIKEEKEEKKPEKKPEPKKEAPKPQEKKQAPKPAKSSDPADALKDEGNVFYKNKQFEEAIKKYDEAIELKPTEILYYNNKAAVYLEQGNIDSALEVVNNAIAIADDNMIYDFVKRGKIYARKGACYMKQQDYASALEWYGKSLLEDQVSSVIDAKRKCEKLKTENDKKAYLSPELAEKASEEGKALFLQGSFPQAMAKYEEAIKRDPKQAKYYFNRGVCFSKLMEWVHSSNDFTTCLELDPNYNKAYLKKGQCYIQMQQIHKAIPIFEEGLKKDPNNNDLKQALQRAQYSGMSGAQTEEQQKQRYESAMKDPEIQQILQTPEIRNALQSMQQDPRQSQKIMQDPSLAPKINKLIQAGVLKVN